jgi:hypothetical protein
MSCSTFSIKELDLPFSFSIVITEAAAIKRRGKKGHCMDVSY